MCASSAESGSSSRSTAGSRAIARASATRWRSPPESLPGRSRASSAIRSRSRTSSTSPAFVAPKATFARTDEVREERVLLEHETDRTALRWQVDARRRVEPRRSIECDPARVGPEQPGDRAQDARLARAGRADEGHGLRPDLERQLEADVAETVGKSDVERRHEGISLTVRRTAALDDDEPGADREGRVEVDVELLVDREGERLGDALQRAGEHDRGAELADAAGERQRRAGGRARSARAGSATRPNVRAGPAPSVRAASVSVESTSPNAATPVRM